MKLFSRLFGSPAVDPAGPRAVYRLDGPAGQVLEALRAVVDPELGRDVVALGMVRSVEVRDGHAEIALCPTTAGCPLADWLVSACGRAAEETGVSAEVRLVLDPPWSPDDMEP